MNGQKIMCVKVEGMTWLDSLNYMAIPLRKQAEAFGLASKNSWCPHLFNTAENMNYVVPMPDASYYGLDQMSHSERKDILSWYKAKRQELCDKRRTPEQYCQADVTLLREACQTFRKHLLQIGDVEVFVECMTISAACNRC